MKRVNFYVLSIPATSFTGGLLAVLQYANGLQDLGHDVSVIPVSPSTVPKWFDCRFRIVRPGVKSLLRRPEATLHQGNTRGIRKLAGRFLAPLSLIGPYSYQRASQVEWIRDCVPEADVSI